MEVNKRMNEFVTCEWCGDLLTNHTRERLTACDECLKKDLQTWWHRDGQIFFCDGDAWGVQKIGTGKIRELKTICLGTETEVLEQLRSHH